MLLVNIDYIPGKEFEVIGVVKGSMIQTKHLGNDIANSFKTSYTEMMNEARATATARMVKEAESLGADAIINIRYASSAVMQGAAEVMSYGTAVKYKN